MSRWHRENPEYYERYGEPAWTDLWDMRDKSVDRRKPVLPECPACGWRHTGRCLTRRKP